MAGKDLLLFTTTFPYGTVTEASFVMAELPHLCRQFRRVIIIPELSKGEAIDLSAYGNVTVDTSRVNSIDHRTPLTKLRFALHPSVISQGLRSLPHAPVAKWPAAWSMAINRYRIGRNLLDIMRRHNVDCRTAVFYTFWFDHVTEAIALTLPADKGVLVSGAHGHDIYPYPNTFKSHPFRLAALRRMARLYAASEGGAEYLRKAYPQHTGKIVTRTLGSSKTDHDFTARPHRDNEPVTFLSCSRVDDNKRVTLNHKLLLALAEAFPSMQFRWIHIGDGDKMPQVRAAIAANPLPNLTIELKGTISNPEVHGIYMSTAIDWVMLLSRMEGNPIALAEALSYGVPVIACNVPGCKEIADDTVGLLLTPDPTPEEFISRIRPYITATTDSGHLRQATDNLRQTAFNRWSEHFDASKLRAKFAAEIASL